jgi:hypothetical protein
MNDLIDNRATLKLANSSVYEKLANTPLAKLTAQIASTSSLYAVANSSIVQSINIHSATIARVSQMVAAANKNSIYSADMMRSIAKRAEQRTKIQDAMNDVFQKLEHAVKNDHAVCDGPSVVLELIKQRWEALNETHGPCLKLPDWVEKELADERLFNRHKIKKRGKHGSLDRAVSDLLKAIQTELLIDLLKYWRSTKVVVIKGNSDDLVGEYLGVRTTATGERRKKLRRLNIGDIRNEEYWVFGMDPSGFITFLTTVAKARLIR